MGYKLRNSRWQSEFFNHEFLGTNYTNSGHDLHELVFNAWIIFYSHVIGWSMFHYSLFTIHHLQLTLNTNFKTLPAILQGFALHQSLEYAKHNRFGIALIVFVWYRGVI